MPLKNLQRHQIKDLPELHPSADKTPVRPLEEEEQQTEKEIKPVALGIYVVLLILGVATGFILSRRPPEVKVATVGEVKTEDGKLIVGIEDTETFKDSATGVIEIGGLDNEGTHKLIRDGGPSQTVYLISSVVDLDQFDGKKVTVWGETFAGTKAVWLMDVGKVEM